MEESDVITLKIRNPNNEDLLNLTVPKSTLISEVKQTICERLPNNPLPKTQKLIYRGRLCKDESAVKDILPSDFIEREIFMHIIIPQSVVKPVVVHQSTSSSLPPPIPSPKTNETLSPTQSISSTIPNPPSSAQSPLDIPPPDENNNSNSIYPSSSPQVSSLSMNSYTSSPTTPSITSSPSPFSPEQIDYMNQAISYYQQYLTQYQNYLQTISGNNNNNNNNNQSLHNSQQRNSPIDEVHRLEQQEQENQNQNQQNRIIHRIRLVFDIKMIIQLIIFGCVFGQGYGRKGKIIISLLCLFLYLIKTGMLDPMKYFLNSDRGTIRQDDSSYYDYIIPFLSFFLSLYPGWNAEPIPLPENANDVNQQPPPQENNNNNNENNQPIIQQQQQQINENNINERQQQPPSSSSSQPPVSLHNDNDNSNNNNNQSQQIIDDKKEKHDWDVVTTALWLKYPNPKLTHVESVHTIDSYIDGNGNLRVKRILTTNASIPRWIKSLTGFDGKASFVEDIIVDPQNHTYTSKSENISYKKYTSSTETCEYTTAENGQTQFKQQMKFDFFVPFKEKIESYSMSSILANARKGVDVMESICSSLANDLKNTTTF